MQWSHSQRNETLEYAAAAVVQRKSNYHEQTCFWVRFNSVFRTVGPFTPISLFVQHYALWNPQNTCLYWVTPYFGACAGRMSCKILQVRANVVQETCRTEGYIWQIVGKTKRNGLPAASDTVSSHSNR